MHTSSYVIKFPDKHFHGNNHKGLTPFESPFDRGAGEGNILRSFTTEPIRPFNEHSWKKS